jgi:hypothetical protein
LFVGGNGEEEEEEDVRVLGFPTLVWYRLITAKTKAAFSSQGTFGPVKKPPSEIIIKTLVSK